MTPETVTLDGLFRANAAARPKALALADAPGRPDWTDGAPQRLTYEEADAKVERLARRFRALGLEAGAVVAVQLPNIVENVLCLLALLRAGLVAAPAPMLWQRAELVRALRPLAPRAFVTVTRHGGDAPARTACEAALELFSLSFPCAFGAALPDGVIPLDLDGTDAAADLPASPGDPRTPVIATFDAAPDGFFAVARSHAHWLAAGLAVYLEAKIASGDGIVTTLPPASLAGIGGAFVPWLLGGGTLQLAIGRPRAAGRAHLLAPAQVLGDITERFASVIAVQRSPERALARPAELPVTDLFCFGEAGCIALRREPNGAPRPIPLGPVTAPTGTAAGPRVIETRIERDGTLGLAGAMVTAPHGAAPVADGFIRTGFRARPEGAQTLVIEGAPERIATMGGVRYGLDDLSARVSEAVPGARVSVAVDPLLGARLHVEAADPDAAAAALEAAGHSRLVIEAVARAGTKLRAAG